MPFRSAFSSLFTQDVTIAFVVFGLVLCVMTGAMAYSWRRGRKGRGPWRKAEAGRVELGYAGALVGMVIFLVVSSFTANAKERPSWRPRRSRPPSSWSCTRASTPSRPLAGRGSVFR
ncbi:MAG: hypothetical protein ACRDN0_34485 [Trebonia sp.]